MSPRFHAAVLLSILAPALWCAPAAAQNVVPPPGPRNGEAIQPMQPPAELPKPQRGDRVRNLDFLFDALKASPDADTAKQVENRIWALWMASGSDTATLLMSRVKEATDAKDLDLAIRLLDSVVEIKPDYIEAWNRRATLYYMKKDYARSMQDIRQVLAREPRHFGAISGLGMILQEFGEEKQALEVFRRALAVHPHLKSIPEQVKTLSEKIEGRDI